MKYKEFYDDVYHAHVWIIYKQDADEIKEYLNKHLHDHLGDEGRSFDRFESYGSVTYGYRLVDKTWREKVFIIHIPDQLTTGVLVHECFHLADFILDHAGVSTFPTSQDNNEHFAYYLEYITRNIQSYCDEYDRKLKKKKRPRKAS